MKELVKIKRYYFKNDKIVIKYSDGKIESKNLNRTNLKRLMTKLDKQYNFNMDTVYEAKNHAYNRTTYLTFIACLIEGIIAFAIFLSFKGGIMSYFNISFLLSFAWLITYFLYLFVEFIYSKVLKRKYKICKGMEKVKAKYDSLEPRKTKSKQKLSMC